MKKIIGIFLMFLFSINTNTLAKEKDPYFFLNPKINNISPIEIPFEDIDKKGGTVNAFFWKTPHPDPKLFKVIPFGYLDDTINLKIKVTKEYDRSNYSNNYFDRNNTDKKPMFFVEIFKINGDLTKTSVFQKTLTTLSSSYVREDGDDWQVIYNLKQLGYEYEYGQYQVIITSLLDMPNLTDNGNVHFFLHLFSNYKK